ncbi:MAG: ribonuclease HI [Atopobiaceae bacterium]|nr:ribonuclease HI [Atopobiaceae bacterium]
MPRVVVHTDGASRGNPGPGGYGVVLSYTDPAGTVHRSELSCGFRLTTNNRMELLAAIVAFEALKFPCEVELHSDSQYLVRAFNENWVGSWQAKGWKNASKQPVKNPDLWKRLVEAAAPHTVSWLWVKGHAGDVDNERADELATLAADSNDLHDDVGYQA